MRLHRIAVLGGGPGGLYAARLLKRSHPDCDVSLYEQVAPEDTFGFGVGLASRTQQNLHSADPQSFEDIVSTAWQHDMAMQVPAGEARLSHGNLLAIARTTLLAILHRHAAAAGVRLVYGSRVAADEIDADLIVAADGVNSATRTADPEAFRPTFSVGEGLYLWCGTDFALPTAIFTPATTQHGTFVAHAYPYADDRSTFLVETDEQTWRAAGFDVSTESTPPGESDQVSLDYLADAFGGSLAGHRLIGNRTRWTRFRTVRCAQWSRGNVVLLGDAAHTAHYSIGSGTKLAMEDAIALTAAVERADSLADALAQYESRRRPGVEHLQAIARRSEAWWDSFPGRAGMHPAQLMLAYMTRAGKVSVDRFASSSPDVARTGLAEFAGVSPGDIPSTDIASWTLARPLDRHGRHFADRIATHDLRDAPTTSVVDTDLRSAWSMDADRVVATTAHAPVVWVTGPSDRDAVLSRLDLGERLRRENDAIVVVEAPEVHRDDLVAGVVAHRTDLVSMSVRDDRSLTARAVRSAPA
ncbi:FAD-dependent monooxygenase [Williamsia deligens]|uniref:FAD-dependent monooxygenase n=1 Tax=Williamsia deligens TaxID=321325 RepID=A0ABW3G984_9NOCA|nr:FAD-dependent monooxygenase [Williamsia deligens]MCP2193031.1 anthraniloyl-CoA monooxygenase [Williamsia deligens]